MKQLKTSSCGISSREFFDNQAEEYLSVSQLALLLNVAIKTVRGWVYKKSIPHHRIGPRLIRFKKKEIEQWISKRGDNHGN